MTSTFTIRLSGPEKHAILKAAGRSNASAWARSILLANARPKVKKASEFIAECEKEFPDRISANEFSEAFEGLRR